MQSATFSTVGLFFSSYYNAITISGGRTIFFSSSPGLQVNGTILKLLEGDVNHK
jgi:hypothetical protein